MSKRKANNSPQTTKKRPKFLPLFVVDKEAAERRAVGEAERKAADDEEAAMFEVSTFWN